MRSGSFIRCGKFSVLNKSAQCLSIRHRPRVVIDQLQEIITAGLEDLCQRGEMRELYAMVDASLQLRQVRAGHPRLRTHGLLREPQDAPSPCRPPSELDLDGRVMLVQTVSLLWFF